MLIIFKKFFRYFIVRLYMDYENRGDFVRYFVRWGLFRCYGIGECFCLNRAGRKKQCGQDAPAGKSAPAAVASAGNTNAAVRC